MRQATEALRDLMELVSMPDFEDREGWKRKSSNKKDAVYSKRYSMGKVFTMKVIHSFLKMGFAKIALKTTQPTSACLSMPLYSIT